jgi:alpha-L-fucosidase
MYNYGNESRDLAGDYTIEEATKVTWPTDILNSENTPIKQPFRELQEYMGEKYELGYEHCRSLVNGWFWSATLEPRPVAELTALWDEIGELNGNLLLNVPPDKSGQIPEAYIQILAELRTHMEK